MNEEELEKRIKEIMDKASIEIEELEKIPSSKTMFDGEKGKKIDEVMTRAHAECAEYRQQLITLKSDCKNIPLKNLIRAYAELFGENFPAIEFSGTEEELREILLNCIQTVTPYK